MARYEADMDVCTRAKTAFIQRVDALARAEKGLPLESVWEEQRPAVPDGTIFLCEIETARNAASY